MRFPKIHGRIETQRLHENAPPAPPRGREITGRFEIRHDPKENEYWFVQGARFLWAPAQRFLESDPEQVYRKLASVGFRPSRVLIAQTIQKYKNGK